MVVPVDWVCSPVALYSYPADSAGRPPAAGWDVRLIVASKR